MSTLTNGFVLGTLFLLASGYIIYDAPVCRFWLSRAAGYILYFRIIVTGLLLIIPVTAVLYVFSPWEIKYFDLAISHEHAPILTFLIAVALRILVARIVRIYGKINPDWKYKLELKNLNQNGLNKLIYERVYAGKMIQVTLENRKVYVGWPINYSSNEDEKWLGIVPTMEWSANISFEKNYSKVSGDKPSEQDNMLISVNKIVSVQPFDPENFAKFNSEPTANNPATP